MTSRLNELLQRLTNSTRKNNPKSSIILIADIYFIVKNIDNAILTHNLKL